MSISNLQINKDTYTNVKCDQLECNQIDTLDYRIAQSEVLSATDTCVVTSNSARCRFTGVPAFGPSASSGTYKIEFSNLANLANRTILLTYRDTAGASEDVTVIQRVRVGNVLEFDFWCLSASSACTQSNMTVEVLVI
jgi:hypothetical protein